MNRFHTTVWSRLGAAAHGDEGALEGFVRSYRGPVVAFLRRKGVDASDAEDLAQEVLIRFLDKELLAHCDATRGRFRSYLIAVTLNVLSERRRAADARKRGRGWERAALELPEIPADAQAAFDDLWLAEIVRRAMGRVQAQQEEHHSVLLLASQGLAAAEIGERTDRSPGAARVVLHRARKALADALKLEVAAYSSSEDEYAAELRTFARFFGEGA